MSGINIQSIRTSPGADNVAPAPASAPRQSFLDVQQQVSGQFGPGASAISPADASGNSSPPAQHSQSHACGDSQPRAQSASPTDSSNQSNSTGQSSSTNQSNNANQSGKTDKAGDSAHGQQQTKAGDAQQAQAKKTAGDKAKSAKADSKKKSDDKKTADGNSHKKDSKDAKDQVAVAAAAPVQLLEQQKVDIKDVRGGQAAKTGTLKLDLARPGSQGGHLDQADTVDKSASEPDGATDAASKTANALEQMLQKAVARGAKRGDDKNTKTELADSLASRGFGQQLQLQGFDGQGTSFQLAGSTAMSGANGMPQAQAQAQAPAQTAGNPASAGLSQYSTNVDLPVQHSEWGNQIAGKVSWMANQNIQTADIHVNPPDLGPVHVQMQVHNNQASVTMHSQHPDVRQLLQNSGDRLKDMMQQGGMSLSNFDVSSQGSQQQQQQASSGGSGGGSGPAVAEIGSSGEVELPRSGQMLVGWNRLDLYA